MILNCPLVGTFHPLCEGHLPTPISTPLYNAALNPTPKCTALDWLPQKHDTMIMRKESVKASMRAHTIQYYL